MAILITVSLKSFPSSKVENALEEIVANANDAGVKISYSDVSTSLFMVVKIEDLKVNHVSGSVEVETVTIDGIENNLDDMDYLDLSLEGATFSTSSNLFLSSPPTGFFEVLAHAAFQKNKRFNIQLTAHADIDEGSLSLEELTIDGEDLGITTLAAELIIKNGISDNLSALSDISVSTFSLSLSDDGIVDQLLVPQTRNNQSVSDYKKMLIEKGREELENVKGRQKQVIQGILGVLDGDGVEIYRDDTIPLSINPFTLLSNPRAIEQLAEDANIKVRT